MIAKDRHDGVTWSEVLGELDGACDIDAGRYSDTQALFLNKLMHNLHGLVISNSVCVIRYEASEIFGYAALTDAFGD